MRNYRKYTDEDIIKIVPQVNSLAGLLRRLGLKVGGGNYANMKRTLQRLNLSCLHWQGQAWSKNQRLKDWKDYSTILHLKPHLIKIRGYKCERCNLEKWQNFPIPLEVDHVDGDRTNNKEENLKLLCCNCHALTPTWRGRGNKKEKEIEKTYCKLCNKEIGRYSKSDKCSSCFNKTREYSNINRKVKNRPSKEQLLKEIEETNYCVVGRKYGVSDNTVRKWLK